MSYFRWDITGGFSYQFDGVGILDAPDAPTELFRGVFPRCARCANLVESWIISRCAKNARCATPLGILEN